MRGKQSEKDSHWNDKNHLNDRAFFRTVTEPATLNINHIEERDGGEYRCRVDFAKSPTRNSRIHLTVIGLYYVHNKRKKERSVVLFLHEYEGDLLCHFAFTIFVYIFQYRRINRTSSTSMERSCKR